MAALVITGAGIGLTVRVRVKLPVSNALLAKSVMMLLPAVVGVPEMTPVVELRLKPAGRSTAAKLVVVLSVVIV